MNEEDILELGGNIVLTGFKEIDPGTMIILKKMIGNYARKLSDHSNNIENLNIHMKSVHATESSQKYEIHAQIQQQGNMINAESVERNIFTAIDTVLKKLNTRYIK